MKKYKTINIRFTYLSKIALSAILLFGFLPVSAQKADDPVVMNINGNPVSRSEFEYSYNKNNSEGVIDKKSVKDYVPLFVAYKLKVEAAKDARLDTLPSFKKEFASYRDQQIRPAMIDSTDIENFAKKIYSDTQQRIDKSGGMVKVAHILIFAPSKLPAEKQKAAKAKADSIYQVLKKGADFETLAKKYSQDPGSAKDGGVLPWIVKGQTLPEFESTAWALKDGEMSKPVKTNAGWHIILKKGTRKFFDYPSQRQSIMQFMKMRGLDEAVVDAKLDTLAKEQKITPAKVLENKKLEMEAKDPSLKYLIQEYHDGLLLYEIANRTVWEKAQKDSVGQAKFFADNRANYTWKEPHFKGIASCAKYKEDVNRVQDAVEGQPFSKWADILRTTFNNDSVLRIRVEKGLFTEGMNALVDSKIFGKDTIAKPVKGYPYVGVYGKKINAPEDVDDVRQQVISDYQSAMEKTWVDKLKKQYKVVVNKKVLATVNKH